MWRIIIICNLYLSLAATLDHEYHVASVYYFTVVLFCIFVIFPNNLMKAAWSSPDEILYTSAGFSRCLISLCRSLFDLNYIFIFFD